MILVMMKWRKKGMNKDSKRYFSNLKLFIPIRGKNEQHLLENIKFHLDELNESNPHVKYEQICQELGAPQEVSSEYLYNMDTEYLVKRLRVSGYIRKAFIAFLIALVITVSVRSLYLYRLYQECKNEIIVYEEEYIE